MPDIEERLRGALRTLADEVEPAADPRAELARRVGVRRRRAGRVPAVAAAVTAAAAVVAAVTFLSGAPRPAAPAQTTTPTTPAGEQLADLGTVVRGGESLRAVGYLQGDRYCTMLLSRGVRTHRPTCEPVPAWPDGRTGLLVQTREVLNGDPADDTGMFAHRLLFLTDPRVATLTVRRGDGAPAAVTELDRDEHAGAFLADFAGPADGFGYTALDADGKVLEEGIT
jgi:hypothetical protein